MHYNAMNFCDSICDSSTSRRATAPAPAQPPALPARPRHPAAPSARATRISGDRPPVHAARGPARGSESGETPRGRAGGLPRRRGTSERQPGRLSASEASQPLAIHPLRGRATATQAQPSAVSLPCMSRQRGAVLGGGKGGNGRRAGQADTGGGGPAWPGREAWRQRHGDSAATRTAFKFSSFELSGFKSRLTTWTCPVAARSTSGSGSPGRGWAGFLHRPANSWWRGLAATRKAPSFQASADRDSVACGAGGHG